MAKEGESYLDQLLNTVAPDWEENSSKPEKRAEDVSLDEALAILNDIPDDVEEIEMDETGEDVEELLDLLEDIENVPEVEREPEPDVMTMETPSSEPEEVPDMPGNLKADAEETVQSADMPDFEEESFSQEEPETEPVAESEEETKPEAEAEVIPDFPEDTKADAEEIMQSADMPDFEEEPFSQEEPEAEPAAEPELSVDGMELDPDSIPEFIESGLPEEESSEEAKAQSLDEREETEQKAEDAVSVDDIFQDALSAVGYSENEEHGGEDDIFALDELLSQDEAGEEESSGVETIPAAEPTMAAGEIKRPKKEKRPKGPGLFKRLFGNIVTEQTAEEEENERIRQQEAMEKKAAQRAEKKQQAALSKEEKATLAAEQKERKKQLKAEQAAKKAEQKAEKKRLKEEQAAQEAQEVVGKINPIGATIVIIFFVTIGAGAYFGSMLFSRSGALSDAKNYFANGEYMKAYDSISAVTIKEDDETLYQRIRICSQLQKELNSHANYSEMSMKLEALDSLIKGIRFYDLNKEEAGRLGILSAVNGLESQLAGALYTEFGMSETQARELLAIEDRQAYTARLQEIVDRVASAKPAGQ